MAKQRFSRQSFLGPSSQDSIEEARVAVIGLGGGGSHLVQQLAHLGVLDFLIYDADRAEDTNLNRLIGATEQDVRDDRLKTDIAERLIKGISEAATVRKFPERWQHNSLPLRTCDVIFGAVDSFSGRRELEAHCRRFFIPYIDIGMDVSTVEGEAPRMAGQVFLSLPTAPCMHCVGLLNDTSLAREAARYGDAGEAPQVVWANGLLASAAIGLWLDLLTGWTAPINRAFHLSYDGNAGTLSPHPLLQYAPDKCVHYPIIEAGDPIFSKI